jgi:hypothetical protein
MAKKNPGAGELGESTPETETTGPRPPQGLTPRYFETGNPHVDFHRLHQPTPTVPGVRRIDPASLRTPEGYDPFLRYPSGAVVQVRADHAAEMLELGPTGGSPVHKLATDEEIEAEKARQQASLRR